MDEELEKYPGISPKPIYGVFGACGYLPNSILFKNVEKCIQSEAYNKMWNKLCSTSQK